MLSKSELCYDTASKKEYLLVSRNSYSSSSIAGNTRKYHGLLVKNGYVLLSTVDEFVEGERISCSRYKNAIVDEGLEKMYAYIHPARFLYWVSGIVEKRIILEDGGVRIIYKAKSKKKFKLIPLIAMRNVHSVRKDFEDVSVSVFENGFTAHSNNLKLKLEVSCDDSVQIDRVDYTYYNVFYDRECKRGYECCENLYAPVKIEAYTDSIELLAYTERITKKFTQYRFTTPERVLELACDSFIVGDWIVAGYHWFNEPWGRDAFVSLPGLLLERGLFGRARRVFLYFVRRMKNGIIPNRVLGKPSYNSSDSSLWFIYALDRYMRKTNDTEFFYRLRAYIESILEEYPNSEVARLKGSMISVAPQTTWMDTRFTPRNGKAIEINALWINALAFADRYSITTTIDWRDALKEFKKIFWNGSYFNDLDGDNSLRPNQVIALAVLTSIPELKEDEELYKELYDMARKSCCVVEKELLTPYGLRTLSPSHPDYIGRYMGDVSYHNGCVWPWLTGFYFELKRNVGMEVSKSELIPVLSHIYDAGIGYISEIFDGDAPHEPNGCIAQAWSVAEVYRALKIADQTTKITKIPKSN
jgi:glycogen debranching enzyme